MSRGHGERLGAWQAWLHLLSINGQAPIAYEHQCGSLGKLSDGELGDTVCPGCHFEIARPEIECEPLYGPPKHIDPNPPETT